MTSTSASTVPSQQPRAVKRAAVVTHGKPQAIGSALARLANVARESGVELVFAAGESEKHGLGPDGAETSDVDIAVVLGGDGTMLRALARYLGTVDALVDVIEEHGVGAVDQMDEELPVALRSGQSGVYDADRRPTPLQSGVDDLPKHATMDVRVPDDAAAPNLALAGLELRLDEHDRIPTGREQAQHRWQRGPDADEGDVGDEQVGAERQLPELAGVRALEHGHPWVGAQLRVELAVADVDGDHARDPVLEQVVGEAARRRPHVDRVAPVELDVVLLERVRELLATAGDEARPLLDRELGVVGYLMSRLVVAGHEPGQDECLCLSAARCEPALDQKDVEALLHRVQRSGGVCYRTVMELRGERVVLRPLAEADVPRIVELGADPDVARWWPGLTPEHVSEKTRGGDDGTVVFAIVSDGEVAGMIPHYEEKDEDFRHAGIDLFLGAPYHGNGLGTDAVRTMARHLIDDLHHHRLTIDPAAHNDRAIRCYEKAGFRRVGVMREYWRAPDGVWRDGLLLDLLAKELT